MRLAILAIVLSCSGTPSTQTPHNVAVASSSAGPVTIGGIPDE